MEKRTVTLQEIQEAMIGSRQLKPTEMVELIMAKNKKQLVKRIKKYAKKYA